jgi:polyhydroxybutyrate depolymerase
MMANRLACEVDWLAAAALVAGVPEVGVLPSTGPRRPVPVIAFHGTEDRIMRYEGGRIGSLIPGRRHGTSISVAELECFWVEANHCDQAPRRQTLPATRDGSHVEIAAYTGETGEDVVFYKIVGGGHTWPGGKQFLPRLLAGNTNRSINASELIWRFFVDHPLH